MSLNQFPAPGARVLKCAGDILEIKLSSAGSAGRAFVRTNIGRAHIMRREIIEHTDNARPYLAADWHDIEMTRGADGSYRVCIPLADAGFFLAKAFFLPDGATAPQWPDGDNIQVKVAPAFSVNGNSIYTAFVRQFRDEATAHREQEASRTIDELASAGYAVIPPSGTFRNVIRRLDHITGALGFRILQLLPIHPVPTTYARMGRYGSPFASLNFYDVDPAYAEFDGRTTPLEQFRELVDAVHAHGARIFIDLPANHTGWASTFQTTHPEWFRRKNNGDFLSPGAWGVVWADLVELDYSSAEVRAAMADVFMFWCGKGVDGFRCDAGYMIPAETWKYITARVREVFPETVFMLEGLGGRHEVTDSLLSGSNLDWAYSELFQEENRDSITAYLASSSTRAENFGPLVHFAETHDNNRLAARGSRFASMRTALSAMLSYQGAFGITAGVEWFCRDKIDVHGALPLNWGSGENQIGYISRLNALLSSHPSFAAGTSIRLIQRGGGNVLAALRHRDGTSDVLVCVNLDAETAQRVEWPASEFSVTEAYDLISGNRVTVDVYGNNHSVFLVQGAVLALSKDADTNYYYQSATEVPETSLVERQRRNKAALSVLQYLTGKCTLPQIYSTADDAGNALADDPFSFCAVRGDMPRCIEWHVPRDAKRIVMVPPGHVLCIRAETRFRAMLLNDNGSPLACEDSIAVSNGGHAAFLQVPDATKERRHARIEVTSFHGCRAERHSGEILLLPPARDASFNISISGDELRQGGQLALLANRRGAMSQVRSGWGDVRSQYDAILAINPNHSVPDNRLVFFTRCRAWVQNVGYSYELDSSCTESFRVESDGRSATWRFRTPVGMGRSISLAFRIVLAENANRVDLKIIRDHATSPESLPDDVPVSIVLRPDIEARDFHCKTLAYQGPEQRYPESVFPFRDGFDFACGTMPKCRMKLPGGEFHPAGEWTYSLHHSEDGARGLGATGDVYSPGWFNVTLRGGEAGGMCAGILGEMALAVNDDIPAVTPVELLPNISNATGRERASTKLADWLASNPLDLYVADRDNLKTVIAGYPWFLDWGRDTLIVLRGLLAAGRIDESIAILREFGRFEEDGTLPNIIHGDTVGNRDTADAPLWYAISVGDLADKCGATKIANLECGTRTVRDVLKSIVANYIKGTPNGIRVDKNSGLVFSPSHFTWMDTNYPAGTPRCGYPVEIQALWIATLSILREKFGIADFFAVEERARASLLKYYVLPDGYLADSLRAENGIGAAQALPEDALRPNQLLAITLGAISEKSALAASIVRITSELLIPGGIRSLADRPVRVEQPVYGANGLLNDPHNPFWGEYTGDEDTRRKPAYHNGTAWGWQFPLYCEALAKVYGKCAEKTALALLASTAELMETGCLGQLPEIMDGAAPHAQRGCMAQAWSVSELIRVWNKYY